MVIPLQGIKASNATIQSTFPDGLVAVFVGATAGIGEYTLLEFARCVPKSRIYFIGRSEADGARVKAACEKRDPHGKYTFLQKDVSLIKNVDEICEEIRTMEPNINLLFMTQGTLDMSATTSEGIPTALALMLYSRTRFIQNLLPQLSAAGETGLARVVSVATATHEGPIDVNNLDMTKMSMWIPLKMRGMAATMVTLTLDHLARRAPQVSFIHSHPGPVYSKIDRTFTGWLVLLKWLIRFLMLFKSQSALESGARHVFLATSDRWPTARKMGTETHVQGKEKVADGIDGKPRSGMYSVNEWGGSAGKRIVELLVKYRGDGTRDKLWKHVESKLAAVAESIPTRSIAT